MSARLEHGAEPVPRWGAPSPRLYLVLGGLAVFALLLVLWSAFRPKSVSAAAPHAIPVTIATVTTLDVPLSITSLGAAQAWTSDTILAQVSGKLIRVDFVEGSDVRAGQLLAEIDPSPYRAVLTEAEGTLNRDRATLAGARRDLDRYRRLLVENAIARQTEEDQAAVVAQEEGVVQFDEGQVAAARINLRYCRIVSPISGRAGVRLVDPGNLVSAGGSVASTPSTASATSAASPSAGGSGAASSSSGIVVINQIQPIAVTFTVPEGELQRLVDASDGFRKPLPMQAFSQETAQLLDAGELLVADNRVDPSTGTVELKAQLPNATRRLWPGQFVNVRLTLQTLPRAITIPLAAVNRGPQGQFAFVVTSNNHVAVRPIAVGWTQGQIAVVASGLRPGELVVTDGQMTLKNGTLVRVAQIARPGSANL